MSLNDHHSHDWLAFLMPYDLPRNLINTFLGPYSFYVYMYMYIWTLRPPLWRRHVRPQPALAARDTAPFVALHRDAWPAEI